VKPATVIAWHRRRFQRSWRWRSRKPGRPRIPDEHIALIRRISADQPGWGEDRIAEELALKLGVMHSTYIPHFADGILGSLRFATTR
jgi:hypothetical protein